MTRLISLYGAVAGFVIVIPMIWVTLRMEPGALPENGQLYGYLTMIIALTAVFLGVKQYRDKVLGGVVKFGPALLVGLGISAVASVVYVVGWEIALAWSGVDFADTYAKAMIDAARAKGLAPAELQKAIEDAESFAKMYRNPLYRMPITFIEMFPVGALISLLAAALLRNPRVLPARAIA